MPTTGNTKQTYWSKAARFLKHQVKQVRNGGWSVFWRNFIILLWLFPALPVVLFIRLLRPLVLIRFGQLIGSRIGHLAFEPELYLTERDLGMQDCRALDVFYYSHKSICNYQLIKMWDRTLCVFNLVGFLDKANRLIPGSKKHIVPLHSLVHKDVYGLFNRTKPHLTFLPDEEIKGAAFLMKMGIPQAAPFICFMNRDSAYLRTRFRSDFSYHDYRDSDIKNYLPAAEELAERGYYLIRMGAVVKEALLPMNPRIIDYATKYRTDFMDVYLFAKCRFLIASDSGPCALSWIFRRPIAFVNLAPLILMRVGNHITDLYIPKKIWLIGEKRFMTFGEIIASGAGRFDESSKFKLRGIELIENSPGEIKALAIEMDERLRETWQSNGEDEELQQRFRTLFRPTEINGVFGARIGAEFLRQHRDWLE